MQAKYHEGNTMYAFEVHQKTQQEILEEKEYQDYKVNCELNQNGIPGHLLMGHGPELEHFERRDIATVKNLSYQNRETADQITHSMTYHKENTKVEKIKINTKEEDVPKLFGNLVPANERQPKGYGEFTKKCDNNYLKMGLRK